MEANLHRIEVVCSARQALHALFTLPYDLILLDARLPDQDGFELCRQIWGQGMAAPILILSDKSAVEDRVQGLEAGADDYLIKPFAFEELQARVNTLARRQGQVRLGRRLQVADLVLDHSTYEVRRGERLVHLTPTEFKLLAFLMQHHGRVMSRTMIEDRVWNHQHDASTNVVDVYIRRLRRKIEPGIPPRLIHTVRGVEYMLKA